MITDHLLEGSPMKLKNPVALVTGASSGIGKATAERLATAGYKVYGTSRRGATSGQRAFEMLSLDVTSDESVAAAVNALLRSEGRLDLLVNNAGFSIAPDRKSTRLNSSHLVISYAVFCLKKKKKEISSTR